MEKSLKSLFIIIYLKVSNLTNKILYHLLKSGYNPRFYKELYNLNSFLKKLKFLEDFWPLKIVKNQKVYKI